MKVLARLLVQLSWLWQQLQTLLHVIEGALVDDSARAVFLAWERLRLVYNAVLAVVVLATEHSDWSDGFLVFLAAGAFAANVCFCIGPVIEGYLILLFSADRRVARWSVFAPGLGLACCFAVVWLSFWPLRLGD